MAGNKAANRSYVISVSYGKGCYRHIRIDGTETLWHLHRTILDAFEFDDDHMHVFFMDNKAWSRTGAYWCDGVEDEDTDRYTSSVTLNALGLTVGRKFVYLFDYGDEWRFACKVLKALDEKTEMTAIIRVVGNPPKQYDYYDEEVEEDPEG